MSQFSLDECNNIIELFSSLPVTKRNETERCISYEFCSIPYSLENAWIFNRFNIFLQQSFNVSVVENIDTIHLFRYSPGDQFTKHRDVYYQGQIYNVGVNLNDDYEGGDFVLHNPYQLIQKQAGKLYTFKNATEHEVTKVITGYRWSLIGFYFYKHLNINPPSI